MSLERPDAAAPRPAEVVADFFSGPYLASTIIAVIFPATGPVAIALAVGTRGGLTPDDMASWFFASFFVNGLITIALSWRYRQPLVFFWTIPGTVLVGPALGHLTFAGGDRRLHRHRRADAAARLQPAGCAARWRRCRCRS